LVEECIPDTHISDLAGEYTKCDHDIHTTGDAKRKRKRCGECAGCAGIECGQCRFCLDKPKFGGKSTLKQCCELKKCKRLKAESDNATSLKINEYFLSEKSVNNQACIDVRSSLYPNKQFL
jgi:hypothetical protein